MIHNLEFTGETTTDAEFKCLNCGKVIGFNKEGLGEPHSQNVDGVWVAPLCADEYLGECV